MTSDDITNLEKIKKIHFIGIGGSGMFPMAKILHESGFEITGSDIYKSDTLKKVHELGISVSLVHEEKNITNQDLVVFSAAIKETNPEIKAAKQKHIPIIERSVMLGLMFNKYRNSVGVAGTHGKTSTTSMITSILFDAKKDPTALIGATLPKINGNSLSGKSDIIVAEACEYVDSFLHLKPRISVITNIEADHLDYFGTLDNIKKSFNKFAGQTKDLLIVGGDDLNVREAVKNTNARKIFFGTNENNDYIAQNICFNFNQCPEFDVFYKNEKIAHISLRVPGKHSVYNALSALIACINLGVTLPEIEKYLGNFTGARRRFEILSKQNGITVADDFAHHPTEITTTLNTASKMGFNKVWAIFQPHTYSRTAMLLDDFAHALSIADRVIVSEILPVRELNTYGIHSKDLVKKIKNSLYISTFEEICDYIIKNAQSGDLVLTMGGGNIYKCADMISKTLNQLN